MSDGSANMQFQLTSLDVRTTNRLYVDHGLFEVFVETVSDKNGKPEYSNWRRAESLVLEAGPSDQMY